MDINDWITLIAICGYAVIIGSLMGERKNK